MTEIKPEEHSWPAFLTRLNSDPKGAADGFYRYVTRLFALAPPKLLRSVPDEHRTDLVHDIVVHCIKDDFRVLRRYENKGRPFAVWLYFVSRNLILDWLDRQGRRPVLVSTNEASEDSATGSRESVSANPGTETLLEHRRVLDKVYKCLEAIDDTCRALLSMAAEEWLPREMVVVMGWPKGKAPKLSNDLGYCRKKLENLMFQEGLDIESLKKSW